ncbi:unnamed protein product [Lepeophtheirus salmonis]|uniref:(salmon louse) hypothetical protein n=1 Tax=Lepeophtheirus salmonis TaxID=72036 RepID=A0A7R8HCZ2_LEPSM|nr:unnamed protein product [Lepeophtheirus salmonis]CAF3020388.1 unnamed protein product [Lepeophtheirus salmonis]
MALVKNLIVSLCFACVSATSPAPYAPAEVKPLLTILLLPTNPLPTSLSQLRIDHLQSTDLFSVYRPAPAPVTYATTTTLAPTTTTTTYAPPKASSYTPIYRPSYNPAPYRPAAYQPAYLKRTYGYKTVTEAAPVVEDPEEISEE